MMIFDSNHTNIETILADFNAVRPRLKFTAEIETDNKINCLDITIHRTPTDWRTYIYRKPTFTHTIIPYTSNHPTQHKYAAIRYLYNRLNTHDLLKEDYAKEENIIQNIIHNSSFPIHPRKPPTHKTRKHIDTTQAPPQKWATFTYVGKETTFITNIFKRTNLKIAFRTNNAIGDKLMHKQQITDSYTRSGVYRLTCPDCNKAYVGQTGTVIHYTSNHPTQNKYAAIRYLYNRLNMYDLPKEDYEKEENIIHNIMHNNSFPLHPRKTTYPQNEKTSRYHTSTTTKMGHIYLRRKGDDFYYKPFQTNKSQNCLSYK